VAAAPQKSKPLARTGRTREERKDVRGRAVAIAVISSFSGSREFFAWELRIKIIGFKLQGVI